MHCKCDHESVQLLVDAAGCDGWQRDRPVSTEVFSRWVEIRASGWRTGKKGASPLSARPSAAPRFSNPFRWSSPAVARSVARRPLNKQARESASAPARLKTSGSSVELASVPRNWRKSLVRREIARRARCRASDEGRAARTAKNKWGKGRKTRNGRSALLRRDSLVYDRSSFPPLAPGKTF